MAFGWLLPNLGDPDGRVRRLYVATVNTVALYGCPIWAADLTTMRRAKNKLRRVQRCTAARVIRAYRTVSHAAAMILAGWPPLEFLANMYAEMYWREREFHKRTGRKLPVKVWKAIRNHAQSMMERWDTHLFEPNTAGQRTVGTVRPCLTEWLEGDDTGSEWYRCSPGITALMSTCAESAEKAPRLATIAWRRDTAQHTLAECPAWSVLRRDLEQEVGNDLSLPVLITKMIRSERSWKAVVFFCEQVMLQKEAAERIRRQEAVAAAAAAKKATKSRRRRIRMKRTQDRQPPFLPLPFCMRLWSRVRNRDAIESPSSQRGRWH